MTRPRVVVGLALPAVPKDYDPQDQAEVRRQLHDLVKKVQPVQPKQTVTGAKGGNAALASLITAFANLGFIIDSTT